MRWRSAACTTALLLAASVAAATDPTGHGGVEPPLQRQQFTLGIDQAFPPFQYVDKRGKPAGFDVDLLQAAADLAGVDLVIRVGPWHEIFAALLRGEIDGAPSVVWTKERESLLDFSVPTSTANYMVFVRDEITIHGLADLAGRSVTVERSTFWEEKLAGESKIRVIPVSTPADELRMVARGEADAAIVLDVQGLYLIRELGIEGLRTAGPTLATQHFRVAVHDRGDQGLLRVNDAIAQLHHNGVYAELYDRWFGVLKPVPLIDRRLAFALAAVAVLVLGALLASHLWSRSLQRRVDQRTAELRDSEVANRTLHRQLYQAQKMESLGRFASGIAHDFNNLLTTVLGNVSIVAPEFPAGSRAARGLDSIQSAARSGAKLTHQLLAFGRREPGEPRNVTWTEIMDENEELLNRLVGSRIELHYEAQQGLWPVSIDPTQALQIVMNLLSNARDALEGSGTIDVEAVNVTGAETDSVRLTVRDDGPGMDAETREQIFEPFFSAKGEGGTGLGLATIHGIVTRLAGEVRVESEPGAGSTFDVVLPRARSDAAPARAVPDPVVAAKDAPVLLVEADEQVRAIGQALLLSLGHTVDVVESGEQALGRVRSRRDLAVVITDADLPGFPGLELARALLAVAPALRVLLSSEAAEPVELERDPRIGHLPKPYTAQSLEDAMARVLGAARRA